MQKFVVEQHRQNQERFWDEGPDSEKNYRKNCKKLGPSWYFYNKFISYKYNIYGFREKPFEEIDWAKSIVMIGDSNVEGIGLPIEDTTVKKLEQELDIPVVNLGISGSGIDRACINSLILHNNFPKPKAIVQIWSSLHRYTQFNSGKYQDVESFMPTKRRYLDLGWEERSKFYIQADRELWKNKTIYYEASYFADTAQYLELDTFEEIDLARDQDHPGPESCKLAAKKIAEDLINLGIKQ
tara:strand:+ start:101 stop:820 length:720 start_codon:yes stop_codon:yes gene_type:complete